MSAFPDDDGTVRHPATALASARAQARIALAGLEATGEVDNPEDEAITVAVGAAMGAVVDLTEAIVSALERNTDALKRGPA